MFDSMQQQNKSFVIFFRNDLLKFALLVSEIKPIVKYLTATLSEKQVKTITGLVKTFLKDLQRATLTQKL